MRHWVFRRAFALLFTLLLGCKEELRTGLEREEATRIEWLLRQQGIASELRERGGGWSVSVSPKDERAAVVLLSKNPVRGKPFEEETRSLIPTRGEELRLRESRYAARIKEAVDAIPGVVESRVLLHLSGGEGQSERGDARLKRQPPTASLYVLLSGGVELDEDDLKKLVAGGTGIQHGDVFVVMKSLPPLLESEAQSFPPVPLPQMPVRPVILGVGLSLFGGALLLGRRRFREESGEKQRLRPRGVR